MSTRRYTLVAIILNLVLIPSFAATAVTAQKPAGNEGSKFASAYQGFPDLKTKELGMKVIKKNAALVYYSEDKQKLAEQLADVLDQMHTLAQNIAGTRMVGVHGLILTGSQVPREKLPKPQWINVEGVPCLIRTQMEDSLPLETAISNHMVFPLMIHESIDMGIKQEAFKAGGPADMSWRWWLEGMADYGANRASAKYQKGAFQFSKNGYIEALKKLTVPTLDLAANNTWWPEGGSAKPEDVMYAYGAAHYMIAKLAKEHGEAWIAEILDRMASEHKFSNEDFCRIFKSLTGVDPSAQIAKVEVREVLKFAESL